MRYTYDGLNRLVREDNSHEGITTVYYYEGSNIMFKERYELSFSSPGLLYETAYYDHMPINVPNALTSYNGESIVYDMGGNPMTYRGYAMTWSKGKELSAMSKGGLQLQFKYDFNGMRTSKTVNGVETEYTYVGDKLISQKTGSEVINFAYTNSGAPYGFTYNGASYFYLLNLQDDVIGIYDSTGTVVVKYAYDAWGKLISTTGSMASTVGIKNPIRYRGYYYDTETGLYYLQSRYYDPDTCRFINADSLLMAGDCLQGTNMFAYCLNNPVMYVDPTGMANEEFAADLIVVFAGMIYVSNILNEEELIDFCNEFILPNTSDLKALRNGFTKLAYSMRISEILGNLASSGEAIGTTMDVAELAGAGMGYVGYVYTGFTGLMEIASVAFNPFSSTDDLISTTFSVVNGALGGILATTLAAAAMSFVINSGGTGLWALGAGVLTYFIAGDIIDYFLY